MSQNQHQPFKTDSLVPSSLPSATLGRRRPQPSFTVPSVDEALSPEERAQRVLDSEHERWNERIDKELKGMTAGLKELVQLADISSNPSPLTSSTLPLHLPLRTSALVRSAQNIRDIAHELKLLLLLGDEGGTAARRDSEHRAVREEVERRRERVLSGFEGLLGSRVGEGVQDEEEGTGESREVQDKYDARGGEGDGMQVDVDVAPQDEEQARLPKTTASRAPSTEPQHEQLGTGGGAEVEPEPEPEPRIPAGTTSDDSVGNTSAPAGLTTDELDSNLEAGAEAGAEAQSEPQLEPEETARTRSEPEVAVEVAAEAEAEAGLETEKDTTVPQETEGQSEPEPLGQPLDEGQVEQVVEAGMDVDVDEDEGEDDFEEVS